MTKAVVDLLEQLRVKNGVGPIVLLEFLGKEPGEDGEPVQAACRRQKFADILLSPANHV